MVGQYGTLVVTRVLPIVQWRMGPLNERKVVLILEIHPFSTSMIHGRKSILREMWNNFSGRKTWGDHGVELVWSLYTTFSVLFFERTCSVWFTSVPRTNLSVSFVQLLQVLSLDAQNTWVEPLNLCYWLTQPGRPQQLTVKVFVGTSLSSVLKHYCWWKNSCISWYGFHIPFFTKGFKNIQTVVGLGISEPSTVTPPGDFKRSVGWALEGGLLECEFLYHCLQSCLTMASSSSIPARIGEDDVLQGMWCKMCVCVRVYVDVVFCFEFLSTWAT